MTIKQILITSLLLSLLVVSSAFILDTAKAQTEAEPSDNFQLQAYLTEDQALALVFPECDEIVADGFIMTSEEKSSLEKLLSRRLYEDGFKTYIGRKNGTIQGYAIITEEIGKFHPFTFVVGAGTDGKISNVAVLVYRESRGGEIAKKRFLYQFMGKSFKNPVRINKDIINITGATMSVQCMCAGVRKVLGVINEYYLTGKRDVSGLKVANNHLVIPVKGETNKSQNTNNPPLTKGDGGEFSEVKLIKQTRMIMGTFAEVSIYSNDENTAGKAIEESLDEMERMDRIMSNYKKESELSRLNKKAVKSPVPCNGELLDVIEQSQYYSELSGGAFDITVSPIVALWGFFREKGNMPPDKEIERLLPAVSYKNIVIDRGNNPKKPGTVFFKNPQTQIDLGAIGKGYAVDKALEIIKKYQLGNACINLGGNIYVLGTPPG
ncbi:MAG TPA: FAD:protein FMN transferase, partial [Candidatus Brocadiaceae bacterium]